MASLRVFVSSTCYDLSAIRSQIRSFIFSMGYEPIMSDYNDILYDPRIHTHTSCIEEVNTCDLIILIVGSRFGGKAIPEAISKLDFEIILEKSKSVESLKKKENISVTQLEILKAVELDIPIFTFIDNRLWNDHELYEKNKGKILKIINEESKDNAPNIKDLIKLIDFPSIDKPETAEFIFEFINFLRHRTKGNSINQFVKFEDIELTLKKQWSGLFQRLLNENRVKQLETKRIDSLTNQFEDLKTAILTSITNTNERDVAKGVVRYRKLFEFIKGLKINNLNPLYQEDKISWQYLFHEMAGIMDMYNLDELVDNRGRMMRIRTLLIKNDYTFFELRFGFDYVHEMEFEFNSFIDLPHDIRKIIFEALSEMPHSNMLLRYRGENINKFLNRYNEENMKKDLDDEINMDDNTENI